MKRTSIPSTLKDLSSEAAQFCFTIKRFIKTQLGKDITGTVIVGCSGGVDSFALSIILKCLGIPIILAHLNHKLRKESDLDAQHVASFANKLGVFCVSAEIDVMACKIKNNIGVEEAGRIERYAFLEKVRSKYDAQWIAVGHHLDDLSEDVLLRLIRGTGWPGLAGMKAIDNKRRLLRPLLNTRRVSLEKFLLQGNIVWVEDASNKSMEFKRNRVRHMLLPLFEKENPNFVQSIQRLWLLAKEDESFWGLILEDVFSKSQCTNEYYWIPRKTIITLPKAARLRVYFEAVQKLCLGHGRSDTFFLLDDAIMSNKQEKYFQFLNSVTVKLEVSGIYFFKGKEKNLNFQSVNEL